MDFLFLFDLEGAGASVPSAIGLANHGYEIGSTQVEAWVTLLD